MVKLARIIHRFALCAGALSLSACSMGGAGPAPGFAPPMPALAQSRNAPADGAIFQVSQSYGALHQGLRARQVGDLVTIVLVENITSNKSTNGRTNRAGDLSLTPPTTGPLGFLNPSALNASGEGSFNGGGSAAQRSTLSGTITVTIAATHSNGTAQVVGEKQMSLSQGQEWVQFAGTLRLADIGSDNRIASSQIANARIIYSGKGAMQQASRPGWLSRFFGMISPF